MQKLPTWVEINIDTLTENLEVIRRSIATRLTFDH